MTYQSSVKYSDVKELEIADGLKETFDRLWLHTSQNT